VRRETTNLPSGTRRKNDAGKKIVYVDECGFRVESYRRHGYAPKGEAVLDLISGTRIRTTTLVAARIDSTFTTPCLVVAAMLRVSMLGLKPIMSTVVCLRCGGS